MTDSPSDDPRLKAIEETSKTVDVHRARAFEYETKAIEFANNGFRALTYLNGGALVAIPAAVALFKTDIEKAKFFLVAAVLTFVFGLVVVVLSQSAAFFTMARRAESEILIAYQQAILVVMRHYKNEAGDFSKLADEATDYEAKSNSRLRHAHYWRLAGLCLFWLSLVSFVIGCWLGARAILG